MYLWMYVYVCLHYWVTRLVYNHVCATKVNTYDMLRQCVCIERDQLAVSCIINRRSHGVGWVSGRGFPKDIIKTPPPKPAAWANLLVTSRKPSPEEQGHARPKELHSTSGMFLEKISTSAGHCAGQLSYFTTTFCDDLENSVRAEGVFW